jgi:probable HAF family extracellular repeat protein
LAINDAGQTAGRITQGTDKSYVEQNGAMQLIAQEIDGYATAMNNNGDVLIQEVKGNSCRTLLWRNGSLTDLGDFGGALTMGRDLNDAGQIVGWAETASGDYHPFLWENGVLTDLSSYTGNFGSAVAINEAGVILLKASDMKGERNLLLDHGIVTDLGNFGSSYAVANDLNSRGQIVGWMADASGVMHAFLATPKN